MAQRFGGILFRVGTPSVVSVTKPTNRINAETAASIKGKRVLISKEAAQEAIKQLIDAPIWEYQGAHTNKKVLAVIDKAQICGSNFFVGGEVIEPLSFTETMGLSYDIKNAIVEDIRAPILKVTEALFIGATLLPRRLSAHRTDCIFYLL